MSIKISILVSVYNASAYIERCAESIFNQTYNNLEIIFVNDCSPDNSIEIIKKLLENYPIRKKQVTILEHLTNRGTCAARNTAIDAATGDYVLIVDCDDYIEINAIEELSNKALTDNADIVISDYYLETDHETTIVKDFSPENRTNYFDYFIITDKCATVLWNKLIKRSLYQDKKCRAPEKLNFLDDKHIISRMYYYSSSISKTNYIFYHYNKTNPNAITQTRKKEHFEYVILYWKLFDDFLSKHNLTNRYDKFILEQKIKSKTGLMINTNSYQLRKEYANLFNDEEIKVLSSNTFKTKFKIGEKLMIYLVRRNLFIVAQVLHLLLILNRDIKLLFGK